MYTPPFALRSERLLFNKYNGIEKNLVPHTFQPDHLSPDRSVWKTIYFAILANL